MAKPTEGKWRSLRIPLWSHKRDRLETFRLVCTVVVTVAVLAWLLVEWVRPGLQSRYSPGPLSSVHANLGCRDCHDPGAPMTDRTLTFVSQEKVGNQENPWFRNSDKKCQVCHEVVTELSKVADRLAENSLNPGSNGGTPILTHSRKNQKLDHVESCATCHYEHRGVSVSPMAVADAACIKCHSDLSECSVQSHSFKNSIHHFAEHPAEFRSLETDPGTIKFNHQVHMAAGLRLDEDHPSISTKTWDDYGNHALLENYRTADNVIQLQCNFCHQPTGPPPGSLLANKATSAGSYMNMPTFEQNCKVCHAMQIQFDLGTTLPRAVSPDEESQTSGQPFSTLEIGHAASGEGVLSRLKAYYSEQSRQPNQPIKVGSDVVPNFLWRLGKTEQREYESEVASAWRQVRLKCMLCHQRDEIGALGVDLRQVTAETISGKTPTYPRFWLKHARFDHSRHADMKCSACHPQAVTHAGFARGQTSAKGQPDKPMIVNRDQCLECHQPASLVPDGKRPGPTNCTSCHTYHGGGGVGSHGMKTEQRAKSAARRLRTTSESIVRQ